MRALIPVIMAGVLSILGLIVAIFINSSRTDLRPLGPYNSNLCVWV